MGCCNTKEPVMNKNSLPPEKPSVDTQLKDIEKQIIAKRDLLNKNEVDATDNKEIIREIKELQTQYDNLKLANYKIDEKTGIKNISLLGFKKKEKSNNKTFLLIGSPNVGKSTFFNRCTWQTAPVGNIDRVTVSASEGSLRVDRKSKIIDLPGLHSITPATADEAIVVRSLFDMSYSGAINIIGATSISRDLFLTLQLLEAGVVSQVMVNMVDELYNKKIDAFRLSRRLGVPVSLAIAKKNQGVKETINSVMFSSGQPKPFILDYSDKIEKTISEMQEFIPIASVSKRFIAIQYICGNSWIIDYFQSLNIDAKLNDILKKNEIGDEEVLSMRNTKRTFITETLNQVITRQETTHGNRQAISRKIDRFALKKWISIPLFFIVIFLVYYITFGPQLGGWLDVQWINLLTMIPDSIAKDMAGGSDWITSFVTQGLLGGIITILGFLPFIIILFFFIAVLEQSGFLARISVLLDKSLSKYGVSGRSLITLLTGIGCNIPAILMARNSHSKKERIISILIAPFIACSARLIIFQWIGTAIAGVEYAWLIAWGMTIFSGFFALWMGMAFSKTMFRKRSTFLLTELPKWRNPDFVVILKTISNEVWSFLKRTLTIIFIVNLAMWFLTYVGPIVGPITDSTSAVNDSFLSYISRGLRYIMIPTGLGSDWRLTASIVAAFPAKELAASNLSLLYAVPNIDPSLSIGGQEGFRLSLFGPDSSTSLPIATAVSYLAFVAFYTPCMAATVTIKKEVGSKIMWTHIGVALFVTYLMSIATYVLFGTFESIATQPDVFENAALLAGVVIFIIGAIDFVLNKPAQMILGKYQIKNKMINKVVDYNWAFIGAIVAIAVVIIAGVLLSQNTYTF